MTQQKLLPEAKTYEVEIIYKRPVLSQLHKIVNTEEALELIRHFIDYEKIDLKEFFWVIALNQANYVVGISEIGKGSPQGVLVSIIEVFQILIKTNASAIIIVHNHPSGNTNPSKEDIMVTMQIYKGAKLLGALLVDHIIITKEDHFSFAEAEILK